MLKKISVFGLSALLMNQCLLVGAPQDPLKRDNTNKGVVGKLDAKATGGTIRATKLIGMKLVNRANENVGSISDLVINPSSAQVEYCAVSFGGFLGLGDKWFAVPMEAIKIEFAPNSNQPVLVLDVTKEQMKGAVGFDESSWPNFADQQFTNDIYRRFNLQRRGMQDRNRDGKLDVNVDRGGVNVEINGKKP